MSEIISDLETTVTSADGHEYYVQVAGEQLASGTWEVWLEFVPFDDDLEVLATQTETTQPTRNDVVSWSAALTRAYLRGAFARALGETARFGTSLPKSPRLQLRSIHLTFCHSVRPSYDGDFVCFRGRSSWG